MIAGLVGSRTQLLHRVAIAAGSPSLVLTIYVVLTETTIHTAGINLGPVELIALYVMLAATARWVVPRSGSGGSLIEPISTVSGFISTSTW